MKALALCLLALVVVTSKALHGDLRPPKPVQRTAAQQKAWAAWYHRHLQGTPDCVREGLDAWGRAHPNGGRA